MTTVRQPAKSCPLGNANMGYSGLGSVCRRSGQPGDLLERALHRVKPNAPARGLDDDGEPLRPRVFALGAHHPPCVEAPVACWLRLEELPRLRVSAESALTLPIEAADRALVRVFLRACFVPLLER